MSIPESAYNADSQIVYSAPVHKGCPASWVPKEGGPGYQCALPAGHDGLHDSTPPSVAESDEQYDTSRANIGLIVNRKNWKKV